MSGIEIAAYAFVILAFVAVGMREVSKITKAYAQTKKSLKPKPGKVTKQV